MLIWLHIFLVYALPGFSSKIVLRRMYSSVVIIIFVIFFANFLETESRLDGIPNFVDSISEHLKSSAKTMQPSYGMLRKASLKQMMSSHVLCSKFIWSGSGSDRKPATSVTSEHLCTQMGCRGQIHRHCLKIYPKTYPNIMLGQKLRCHKMILWHLISQFTKFIVGDIKMFSSWDMLP